MKYLKQSLVLTGVLIFILVAMVINSEKEKKSGE